MARVAITNIAEPNVDSVRKKAHPITDIEFSERLETVQDLSSVTRSIKSKEFGILRSRFEDRYTKAETILPFRIRFTSVDIPGYGRENPAPIGIAVIGLNNYIL
jgi:hypothetical protein